MLLAAFIKVKLLLVALETRALALAKGELGIYSSHNRDLLRVEERVIPCYLRLSGH